MTQEKDKKESAKDITNPKVTPNTAQSNDEDSFVGTLLSGRYFVERNIKQGAISSVYFARDQMLYSRPVAIKIMLNESQKDESSLHRFQVEIKALSRLTHPNIITILDTKETADGRPYVIMEYVEGFTLRRLLDAGRMGLGHIANIVTQVGLGMAYAHGKWICHGDLKPENIMVQTFDGERAHVKIMNLGISRLEDPLFRSLPDDLIVYKSPQQLASFPISVSDDVYSLGVIAYEMVTGQSPFGDCSPYQLFAKQKAATIVNPSELCPNLPQAVDTVILKALAYNQNDRYQSVLDFCNELAQAMSQDLTFSYSCFISYSSKDQEFAEKLYADLQSKGVRCWFAPKDLKIGDKFRQRIDESIRLHDKLLLILSEDSISSPWVENEVETAFEREHNENKLVLFPISIDDTVWKSDRAWAASLRRMRHIGEFMNWKRQDVYEMSFER
ncbi:MAG: protein kinase, partial [Acidobacteriota bacterium]